MPLQNIDWNRINDIVGSKGFENIAGLTGSFLKSKGEADRADRTMAANNAQYRASLVQNHSQFAAKLAAELQASKKNEGLNRAVAAMNASRLGENENFATRNRILSNILPKLQGGNFAPSDPGVAATMGRRESPFAGGIPPELLAALGERSTANAIAGRNKQLLNIDPNASMANFDAMGFDPEATEGIDLAGHRQGILDQQAKGDQSLEEQIQRALAMDYESIMQMPGDPPPQQEKKGGFWSGLGKVLKIAAPIGAAFIPGIGPLAAAAIAGGGSAAGSLLEGNPIQDALLGGAMGAAGTYGARNLPRRTSTGPIYGPGY